MSNSKIRIKDKKKDSTKNCSDCSKERMLFNEIIPESDVPVLHDYFKKINIPDAKLTSEFFIEANQFFSIINKHTSNRVNFCLTGKKKSLALMLHFSETCDKLGIDDPFYVLEIAGSKPSKIKPSDASEFVTRRIEFGNDLGKEINGFTRKENTQIISYCRNAIVNFEKIKNSFAGKSPAYDYVYLNFKFLRFKKIKGSSKNPEYSQPNKLGKISLMVSILLSADKLKTTTVKNAVETDYYDITDLIP